MEGEVKDLSRRSDGDGKPVERFREVTLAMFLLLYVLFSAATTVTTLLVAVWVRPKKP